MRISAPYANNSLKLALKHRNAILKDILKDKGVVVKAKVDERPFGDDVRMIRQHKRQAKLLTPAEQDEVIAKYKSGMTMVAIADLYGCHYTTVGRLLRQRGVEIRD